MAHYQYYHSTIIVIYANDLWWLPFTLIHKNLGNATERWFGPFSKHRLILFSWKEISGVWRKKNKFPFTFLGLWLRLSVIKDRLIRKMNRNVVTCRLPRWRSGKKIHLPSRRWKRHWFDPLIRKIPWKRKWQPTPVFLLGKFHGHRSLAGYSPQGHKECDMTEWLSTHAYIHTSCTHGRNPGKLTLWNGPSHDLKYHFQLNTKERCCYGDSKLWEVIRQSIVNKDAIVMQI